MSQYDADAAGGEPSPTSEPRTAEGRALLEEGGGYRSWTMYEPGRERFRDRILAIEAEAAADCLLRNEDVERLAAAMYAAINNNRLWEDEAVETQARAIIAALREGS